MLHQSFRYRESEDIFVQFGDVTLLREKIFTLQSTCQKARRHVRAPLVPRDTETV